MSVHCAESVQIEGIFYKWWLFEVVWSSKCVDIITTMHTFSAHFLFIFLFILALTKAINIRQTKNAKPKATWWQNKTKMNRVWYESEKKGYNFISGGEHESQHNMEYKQFIDSYFD